MTENADTIRIAMWSGPRNISTAMMRSWEARGDCDVVDEPLYAHYLQVTGLPHPGAADTLARHEAHLPTVLERITGASPTGKPVFYQKHMAHHMLPDVPLGWLPSMRHAMLIREPARMVASLAKGLPNPTVEDTGLPQQVRLFEEISARCGEAPPVYDSAEILADPPASLSAMCSRLGVTYTDAMLSWAPGRRETDGAWATHWYAKVEASIGFAPPPTAPADPPARLLGLVRECARLYDRLRTLAA